MSVSLLTLGATLPMERLASKFVVVHGRMSRYRFLATDHSTVDFTIVRQLYMIGISFIKFIEGIHKKKLSLHSL